MDGGALTALFAAHGAAARLPQLVLGVLELVQQAVEAGGEATLEPEGVRELWRAGSFPDLADGGVAFFATYARVSLAQDAGARLRPLTATFSSAASAPADPSRFAITWYAEPVGWHCDRPPCDCTVTGIER